MTVPKVATTYVAGDRWYVDPGTGDRVPGVSAILAMMPKPALPGWAARETATFAVDNLEPLSALAKTDRNAAIALAKGAPWRMSGKAASVGTEVHHYAEEICAALLRGEKPAFRVTPDAMPFLRNFARFVEEFNVRPVLVETTVWDDEVGYAGTFDGIYEVTIKGLKFVVMIDTKTGASGIWPEAALQQTAYKKAKWYIDPETGERRPMLKIDAAFGLWLRPDGWALIPLSTSEENWEQFKRLRESFEWKRLHEKHAVGKAINTNPLKRKWSGAK